MVDEKGTGEGEKKAPKEKKTTGNVMIFEVLDDKTLSIHSRGFASSTLAFKALAEEVKANDALVGRKFVTGTINSEIKSPTRSTTVTM